jgi:hypothetical protein
MQTIRLPCDKCNERHRKIHDAADRGGQTNVTLTDELTRDGVEVVVTEQLVMIAAFHGHHGCSSLAKAKSVSNADTSQAVCGACVDTGGQSCPALKPVVRQAITFRETTLWMDCTGPPLRITQARLTRDCIVRIPGSRKTQIGQSASMAAATAAVHGCEGLPVIDKALGAGFVRRNGGS